MARVSPDEWLRDTGVVVLVRGSAMALGGFVLVIGRGECVGAYVWLRQGIGRAILLGPEVLIIADIVLTITVDTAWRAP